MKNTEKILLYQAIMQSNLHPTTKSFLSSILKNVDGRRTPEFADAELTAKLDPNFAFQVTEAQREHNRLKDQFALENLADKRRKDRNLDEQIDSLRRPLDIPTREEWPGDSSKADLNSRDLQQLMIDGQRMDLSYE